MSVYRWFSELVNEMVDSNQWLDTEVLFRATSQANALYEFIFDKPAPGATSQAIQGHDHTTTQGGRTCARGTVYSGGAGQDQFFKWEPSAATTWYSADNANSSSKQRSGSLFWAYCSGTTTGASSPYTTPVAWLHVRVLKPGAGGGGNKTVSARINNVTLSKYSETKTFTVAAGGSSPVSESLDFVEVPIQPGWNEFDIEYQTDKDSPVVYTTHLCLMEAADENGCYESSTGVSPLGGV